MKAKLLRYRSAGIVTALGLVALGLGLVFQDIAFDDPFVTYRYAENLATGSGFVYNIGERVLSTTTPLYALLLAAIRLLTTEIPLLSNWIGIASLWAGASLLYYICDSFGQWVAGTIAGLLYVTFPLLWLSVGFEVPLYLMLILAGYAAYFRRRPALAAIFLALATLTRADAIVAAGVLFLHAVLKERKLPWRAAAAYLLTMAPVLVFLAAYFGSPVPVTLAAKNAQTALGVTGFYAGTQFLQGAWILAKAWFLQTPLYILLASAAVIGFVIAVRQERWALWLAVWAVLYSLGYHLLRVAPYHWYYAPLVPAGAALAGLGVAYVGRLGKRPAARYLAVSLLALGMLGAQGVSLYHTERALHGDAFIPPDLPAYKVLPEVKTDVYRRVGEWLAVNTPADADVGVTEVGVMGYYSRRRMVDFLGLLRPDVAEALRRGDVAWALFHYQPDYLALTEVNPLYSYDIRRDEWFRAAYEPVQQFADPRFWGSPVTVYRRAVPRSEAGVVSALPSSATPLDFRFGPSIRLIGYEMAAAQLRPGEPLDVTLYWQSAEPVSEALATFVHVLGEHDLVVAQRDGVPCMGGCPVQMWPTDQVVADRVLLALPETAYAPDHALLEIGLYTPANGQRLTVYSPSGQALGDNARFAAVDIQPNPGEVPNPLHINFDNRVALVGYDLDRRAVSPGEVLRVTLYWDALTQMTEDYTVFVHLLGEGTDSIWGQQDAQPGNGQFPTSLWEAGQTVRDDYEIAVEEATPPLVCIVEVGLYDADTGQRLAVLDADGRAYDNRALLSKVRVWP
jgi:hypothetical protein